jgi:hypothetical protein
MSHTSLGSLSSTRSADESANKGTEQAPTAAPENNTGEDATAIPEFVALLLGAGHRVSVTTRPIWKSTFVPSLPSSRASSSGAVDDDAFEVVVIEAGRSDKDEKHLKSSIAFCRQVRENGRVGAASLLVALPPLLPRELPPGRRSAGELSVSERLSSDVIGKLQAAARTMF